MKPEQVIKEEVDKVAEENKRFIESEQMRFVENNITKEKSCDNCDLKKEGYCQQRECLAPWLPKWEPRERKMKIILLSGKANHGKDTTANMIKDKLENQGKKVLIAHYGDLVKYTCKTFFDWNGEKDEKGRTLLQRVGTDDVRAKYPNFWVDYVKNILDVFHGEWDCVLIPDTRFPNEIDVMKDAFKDVISIRVVRTNFVSPLTEEQRNHRSEIALDDYKFDYYFIAEDLETLERKVNNFLNELEGKRNATSRKNL